MNGMNSILKKIFLVGILIPAPTYWIVAENFVVKKQQKASAGEMKTDCLQELRQALAELPEALHGLADMQAKGMVIIATMLEGDFFKDMDRLTIEKELLGLQKFLESQQKINELIRRQVNFLHELEQKKNLKV